MNRALAWLLALVIVLVTVAEHAPTNGKLATSSRVGAESTAHPAWTRNMETQKVRSSVSPLVIANETMDGGR